MKRVIAVILMAGVVLNLLFWGVMIGTKGLSKQKRASVEMLDPVARAVVRHFRDNSRLPEDAEIAAEPNFLGDRVQYLRRASNVFQLSCTDAHYGPAIRQYTISQTNLAIETVIGR